MEKKKSIITPIVITILAIIYIAGYFGIIVSMIDNVILKWILGIIPVALCITMVYVCIQRIREIKKGENDDLSKY